MEIVAPAGFGKTFIARRVSGPLGARIAADCRDMETLPSAVRAALRALWPFEPAFEARLGRYLVALDPSDPSPSLWLDVLDEALAQERDGRACWIDNAEGLKTLRWGALVVDRLIAKGVRLLICSRQPPSLPSLSRVPPNERYSVGVRDLRFSDAESAALFPRGTDPQSVQHALAAAQGWPIAVLSYVRAAREDGLEGLLAGVDRTYRSRQLDQYVLKEALSGFSSRALTTLAAIAQLRACAEPDLEALTDGAPEIVEELHRSPFVDWTRGPIEVHALASAALVPRLREARALLREAAARTGDPLRAARLYMAGGDPESAASRLDTVLAPYFLGESSGEFVDIVSSLGRDVLTRHAATWSATITLRAYAMSQHELLAESRAAWAALPDDAPLPLRIGVGLTLANSLLFLNHIEEADSVFDALQRRVDASGAPEAGKAVAAYRAFGTLRGGRRVDADAIMQGMEPLFRAVPESHASALISFAGPADFMRGDRDAARRAFSRGLEIARGVAPPVYLAIGLCNAAFHAWLAGETALFDSCVEELVATSRPIVIGGTRHFIACATSPRPATAVPSYELHYLRAFGYIIAAAREP
ncbi:MAG TPA: hypothetical protein VJP76_09245, partial [Candidatus Tumulicola sp.]|nr:hypothetical protein [Candidatus Tumulicola sp.]